MVRILGVLGVLLLACHPARASLALSTTTYDFNGTCSDCNGTAYAQLVLDNYTLGNSIAGSFGSFTYDGTNLLPTFTITAADLPSVSGTLPPTLPAAASVSVLAIIGNTSYDFQSGTTGFWCAGNSCAADTGNSSSWAVASATPAPEPASLAILTGGVLMLAGAARRRIGRTG